MPDSCDALLTKGAIVGSASPGSCDGWSATVTASHHAGSGICPKTASAAVPRPYHERMTLHDDAAYRAISTHDARFDGRLFVGVTTTRVYCRPVCRVRLPRRENCRFFSNAALAEAHGF